MNAPLRFSTLAFLVGGMCVGAPVQAEGWTPQYYIGVHAGSADGKGSAYDAVGNHRDIGSSSFGGNTTRTNYGVLGGVNFRNGVWLVGLEGDYGYMPEDQIDGGLCSMYSLALCETKYNYHIRARLGYSVSKNVDLFVAAGYAGLRARMYNLRQSDEATLNGTSFGGGADISVMKQGTLRIEVLRDHYGSKAIGTGIASNYGMDNWKDLTVRAAAIFTF